MAQSLTQATEAIQMPPINKTIMFDSRDAQQYDVRTLEDRLFKNKFRHDEFDPNLFSGPKRDETIRILENSVYFNKKRKSEAVESKFPLFKKPLNKMSRPELAEYHRLSKLLKFEHLLPPFLISELSVDGEACKPKPLVKSRLPTPQKNKDKPDFRDTYREVLPVINNDIMVHNLEDNMKRHEIDLETRQRIHSQKLEFIHKRAMINPHEMLAEEPDLIRRFEPKEEQDIRKIAEEIVEGRFDFEAEDRRIAKIEQAHDKRLKFQHK